LLNQINDLKQTINLQKDQSMNFSDVQITDLQNMELKDIVKENKDLLRKIETKENELQELYHSNSFRLTKPLRILFSTVRKIVTHLRSRES
jgi:hypothetical protein